MELPWTVDFDVTVTQLHPFNAQVNVACTDPTEQQVRASVSIDGADRDAEEATGRTAEAEASVTLTVP